MVGIESHAPTPLVAAIRSAVNEDRAPDTPPALARAHAPRHGRPNTPPSTPPHPASDHRRGLVSIPPPRPSLVVRLAPPSPDTCHAYGRSRSEYPRPAASLRPPLRRLVPPPQPTASQEVHLAPGRPQAQLRFEPSGATANSRHTGEDAGAASIPKYRSARSGIAARGAPHGTHTTAHRRPLHVLPARPRSSGSLRHRPAAGTPSTAPAHTRPQPTATNSSSPPLRPRIPPPPGDRHRYCAQHHRMRPEVLAS
jgi:hypothetical protein